MKQATIDPLYKDCPKHWTALHFNLQMLMLKAHHDWSDTSFNNLLRILANTYPEGNKVPPSTYRAKKLIRSVAMKLKKFYAYPNHCILYWGKYENLQSYSHCGVSQHKRNASCRMDADDERGPKKKKTSKKSTMKKQIPSPKDEEEEGYTQRKSLALLMWYLPVIDRLHAILGNLEDAKLMSWHTSDEHTKDDGKLWHPSNSKQWMRFNAKFWKFGDEARNVRPRQTNNDIDVFLEPFMEDMKILWEDGVKMMDASLKEFTLKDIIFVIIIDYPSLFSLSGQIKGKSGCDEPKTDEPKRTRYKQKVFDMVKGIDIEFGKKKKEEDWTMTRKRKRDRMEEPPITLVPFKKQSCFFKYLSYWKKLDTPHAIDCMHLKKNVFESTIGVQLDIKTKTKDGLKSRMDPVNQDIRSKIHLTPVT
ncbi:uncharacterized protein [Miscanthus floridulus]|uniref:uncharacterized protein n=1 Tax=Miscanthus floridulus TaxID=154761 RepID=UPI00345877BB